MNIYGRKCPLESCQDLVRGLLEALLAAEFRIFQEREKAAGRSVWRNGFARKTVRGRFGDINIRVSRDRQGRFEPRIVQKGFILLGELEHTFAQIYGIYNGPRGGRLYVIRDLVRRVYSSSVSGDDLRVLTEAIVRGCRSHRRMLESIRIGSVDPGVKFRYDGVLGLRPEVPQVAAKSVCGAGAVPTLLTAECASGAAGFSPAAMDDNVSERRQVVLSPEVSASTPVENVSDVSESGSTESIYSSVPVSRESSLMRFSSCEGVSPFGASNGLFNDVYSLYKFAIFVPGFVRCEIFSFSFVDSRGSFADTPCFTIPPRFKRPIYNSPRPFPATRSLLPVIAA